MTLHICLFLFLCGYNFSNTGIKLYILLYPIFVYFYIVSIRGGKTFRPYQFLKYIYFYYPGKYFVYNTKVH